MVRSAFSRFVCLSCLAVFFFSLSTAQAQCTGKILGHTDLGQLVCIDPGPAPPLPVTTVSSVVPPLAIGNTRLSALDSAGHRYFFLDDGFTTLYELDTQGVQAPKSLPLVGSVPLVLAGMKFDPSSGKLFGHAYLGAYPGPVTPVTIDPANGNVAPVGTWVSGSLAVQPWIAALDSAGHRYFFLDYTPTRLYVLNTLTGALITALPLSMPLVADAMEFDPSSGRLFCEAYLGTTESLLSIGLSNGNVAPFGAWPSSASIFGQLAIAALDSGGQTYFYLDSSYPPNLQQMNTAGQTGVAGPAKALSVPLILMGMEFAPGGPPPPPPPDPLVAQVQPPINPDGSSTLSTSRGSVPVKFTLTRNGVATCNLPAATISLLQGGATVDPSLYQMPSDDGTNFRNSGCQYVYNLGTGGLGVGSYEADITIAGSVVGKGTFRLGR